VFFEYLPDAGPAAGPRIEAQAPDISERFLGILRNTGGFAAGDVDNTLHSLLAEYYVRTRNMEKASETVLAIKDPAARLDRTEWLVTASLDAGDSATADNAISQGLKATSAFQDTRDFFTGQVILELLNRGLYNIAANVPLQKGLLGDADSECLQILARAGQFIDMYDSKSARKELGKISGIVSGAEEMSVPIYVCMADLYHKAGAEADSEKAFKEAFYASQKNMFFEFIAVRAAIAGHFELVKTEAKTVWDRLKGPEYKAVSDAFSGIAEYYERSGDKEKSREAITLAEENAAKLPDGQEKMSALARIAIFHKKSGDDEAARKKFGELAEVFKKLPMRTLGYYSENVIFLDGILKRLAESGAGEDASDLFVYLLDLAGKFESEGKRSGEKMDSSLVAIAERAYDLGRYEEMSRAYDSLKSNSKKAEVLLYMSANMEGPAKEKLSSLIEEMLKASDEGKLPAVSSADAYITVARIHAGEGEADKAAAELARAFEFLSTIDNSGEAGGVKNKYRLMAKAAEIYFDRGETSKALEVIDNIMNDATEIRNAELKKSLAGSAMQALLYAYSKDKGGDEGLYVPGARNREYSKLYW
jgi:tetratricopeptide (TPR) repeat protein